MPASPARIAANRANALRSTGPRTAQGKARSCQNARKHGLLARTHTLPPERLSAAHQYAQHIASTAPHPDLAHLYYIRAILHQRHVFFRQSSQAYFTLYYSQPNRATWAANNIHLLHALNAYFGSLSRQISRCNKLIFQTIARLQQPDPFASSLIPQPGADQPSTSAPLHSAETRPQHSATANEPNARPRRRRHFAAQAPTHHARHCKRTQSRPPPRPPKPA